MPGATGVHAAGPGSPRQRLQWAVQLHQRGDRAGAESLYRQILRELPGNVDALHLLGVIEAQKGNFESAHALINRALRLDARQPLARVNLARICLQLRQPERALAQLEHALQLDPSLSEAHDQRAMALRALGRLEEALSSNARAIELRASDPEAWIRRGQLLLELRRAAAALLSFGEALRRDARCADGHRGRATALLELNRAGEAVLSCEQALRLAPEDAHAHYILGMALLALGQAGRAAATFERALALAGDHAGVHANHAAALCYLGRPRQAIESLQKTLALAPEHPYAAGKLAYTRLLCCDWSDFGQAASVIDAGIAAGRRICLPLELLALSDDPRTHQRCARIYLADRHPAIAAPLPAAPRPARPAGAKISLAYLSADFRDHATAHLIAGLLERHDRNGFELTALSGSGDDGSEVRRRIERAFDHFLPIDQLDDAAVADLVRRRGVDILIDLSGYVTGARPGLLAQRAAPVQVNFLGYPGTLGGAHVDYIIADSHVLPPEDRRHYSERVVYLPDSYQPTDDRRPIASRVPTRAEVGLPPGAFVFCSFNASFKITPLVFDVWMRLLGRLEGSVLWLYRSNDAAADNLRAEALRRGVAPERLVFAPRVAHAEHLARHALADLFLDTLPYNAHTTASDALWAGLPVLTCTGRAFPGRVAGSLLKAVGLPELITSDLQSYEARAFELASAPGTLGELRRRLLEQRQAQALFDTDRYRRHLEAAYRIMWARSQRGEEPSDLSIPAIDTLAQATDCATGGSS